MISTILITGGLGYIGSHTCVALAAAGFDIVIVDNNSTSKPRALHRLAKVLNFTPKFVLGDIRDRPLLDRVFAENSITAVLHFAGLKNAAESMLEPLAYFETNVQGSVNLLHAMQHAGVRTMVFSSSAAVYGEPRLVPICENSERLPTTPYGRSKLYVEDMLDDVFRSESGWSIARLRYFNPAGAHSSGLIGDDPRGTASNLMLRIAEVASGVRSSVEVFGNDYATSDGTGLRDYIHVMDLAEGHVAALRQCARDRRLLTLNLGSGRGHTVMQVVRAFETVCAKPIPVKFSPRRPGDVSQCWADVAAAATTLEWKASRDLFAMCEDAWRWQLNPENLTTGT